ncbi:MAG: FkbM family methyltransferase [Chlamydiae bacterium]|nr:FkbM family methyltransferase [Chlamydiota bacterium]
MMKKIFFVFVFCFISFALHSQDLKNLPTEQKHPTICLNMIVKDESKVIERCLASVKKIIDYWVIVDTGSNDGTQKIIKEFMKDIPGELHERAWVDFAHNRNEALALAKNKGDYLFFIDADEFLSFTADFTKPSLDKDYYFGVVRAIDGTDYMRIMMINNHLDWEWKGVLHEELISSNAKTNDMLAKMVNFTIGDGHRSEDPKKHYKDAEVLEKALEKEPNNTRYVFYLAQAYENAKEYLLAIKNYEKRSLMKGSEEEIFWSLYSIAKLQESMNLPQDTVINGYCKAFQYRPSRAEPLYQLGRYYDKIGNYCMAYLVLKNATIIPLSKDCLFVESWMYDFGILFELSNALYLLNDFIQANIGYTQILAKPNLSEAFRNMVVNNLLLIRSKINPPRFEGMFEEYSNKRLELIAKFLPENPVVFEAGGHNGEDTVKFLNTWPKAKIISFEPFPEAFEKLKKTTSGLSNVSCYNIAVNNVNGKAIFYVCKGLIYGDSESASSLLEPSEMMKDAYKGPKIEVPCVVLDDWCKKNKVDHLDFMWLDLEGLELLTLQSSPKILSTVKVIYTETNFQELRKGMPQYADLKAFLEKAGFKLLSHWYEENFQGNAIFVKKEIFDAKINEIKK